MTVEPSRKRIAMYYNVGFGGGRRWLYEVTSRLEQYHDLDYYCINRASLGVQFPDGADISRRTRIYTVQDLPRVGGRFAKLLNVPASWIDFLRFDRRARSVAREIDAGGYDAVFASIGDYTYAPLVLRHLRTASVYYCHEPMRTAYEPLVPRPYSHAGGSVAWRLWRWVSSDFGGLRKAWDAQAARSASLVLVNSRYTQDYAQRAYGIAAEVNYPGVDTDAFHPGDEAVERFVLSGPGSVIASKGYDWAIRAIATIPAARRPRLVIAGDACYGPERAYLYAQAAELGVQVDIREGIADTELKQLLRTATVMLYTPHLEPFGLAALEAMASGTPVVAVREAGPIETVVDGVTGFLCERDAGQLGTAVLRLLDEEALRRQMGAAGRRQMIQQWSWGRAVEQLQRLLTEAAERQTETPGSAQRERVGGTEFTVARRQT